LNLLTRRLKNFREKEINYRARKPENLLRKKKSISRKSIRINNLTTMTDREKEIAATRGMIGRLQDKLKNLEAEEENPNEERKEKPSKEEINKVVQGTPSWS
jgi:uncharacterized coiled-coil protein SlyX